MSAVVPTVAAVPRVTVVVPVRDEEACVEACLRSVLAQTERSLQVLVVDGRSRDGTRAVVRRLQSEDARIELLDNPGRTVPHALNIALGAARADSLVRVDGHATVPPDYVERAVRHLETGRWGAVGGVKRGVGTTRAGRAIAAAMSSRLGVGGSTYHYGRRMCEVEHVPFGCYPTRLARSLGGWDERLTVNQDFEFDHRVRRSGRAILFDPELVIDWDCRQSLRDLLRQYHRYGMGKVKVARLHPESVRFRHLAPPVLVAGVAGLTVGGTVRPRLLLGLTPYAALLAAGALRIGRGQLSPAERAYLPGALAAMHLGWGAGFWRGLVRQVRDPTAR